MKTFKEFVNEAKISMPKMAKKLEKLKGVKSAKTEKGMGVYFEIEVEDLKKIKDIQKKSTSEVALTLDIVNVETKIEDDKIIIWYEGDI